MRLLQITAFVNELNLKNVTVFLKTVSIRKATLNKQQLFLYFALVLVKLNIVLIFWIMERFGFSILLYIYLYMS